MKFEAELKMLILSDKEFEDLVFTIRNLRCKIFFNSYLYFSNGIFTFCNIAIQNLSEIINRNKSEK